MFVSMYCICSAVLSAPTVILRLPLANSCERPMAVSTWDGSKEADEHALPLEAPVEVEIGVGSDWLSAH